MRNQGRSGHYPHSGGYVDKWPLLASHNTKARMALRRREGLFPLLPIGAPIRLNVYPQPRAIIHEFGGVFHDFIHRDMHRLIGLGGWSAYG